MIGGVLGALALRVGRQRGWVAPAWAPLVPLAATAMAYGLATVFHGSGLIAAFAAGLTFGTIASAGEEESAEMLETIGDGFSATTFLVFGAAIVPMMLEALDLGARCYSSCWH